MFIGCGNPRQKSKMVENDVAVIKYIKPGKHCYLALFEKDTATLSFMISASGHVSGQLNIKYNVDTVTSHQPASGEITGEFKGDTLLADYSFTSGKDKYINPVALLLKNDTLIMGHGKIYYYLGRTYFDTKTPIDYTKSRFCFAPVNCK